MWKLFPSIVLAFLSLGGCDSTTEPLMPNVSDPSPVEEPYLSLHQSVLQGYLVLGNRRQACLVEGLWLAHHHQMSFNGYVKWDQCCVPSSEPAVCPSLPASTPSTMARNIDSELTLHIEADSPLNLLLSGQLGRQKTIKGEGRIEGDSVTADLVAPDENLSLRLHRPL